MLTNYLQKLITQENLTIEEATKATSLLLKSNNIPQISAFMSLLRSKRETSEELTGMLQALFEKMLPVIVDKPVLDIVGTGSDQKQSFNISTGAALLAASCGVPIVKHGNRAVTSQCGSADLLYALGFYLASQPTEVQTSLSKTGFGFCYAPHFHPAFQHLKAIRHELGITTSFNFLGPLLNPAKAEYLMVGVNHPELMPIFAKVLMHLPIKKALVFHSAGFDEITSIMPTDILSVSPTDYYSYRLNPQDYGFSIAHPDSLKGGDAVTNAKQLLAILDGETHTLSDTLILNAAIAQHLYGLTPSIDEGIRIAKKQLASGEAMRNFKKIRNFSLELQTKAGEEYAN